MTVEYKVVVSDCERQGTIKTILFVRVRPLLHARGLTKVK